MNYIIITPAKDEERYIEYTLSSVCRQTLKPRQWVIVNDGSNDKTVDIVVSYMKKYQWIKLINNNSRNEKRAEGGKIVRAFYKGYSSIEDHSYDFIVKLDADLTLPENYFQEIANAFQTNPQIGICGGRLFFEEFNKYVPRSGYNNYVSGPFKAYSKACFKDIGGILPVLGWDGLDLVTAMYKGWIVRVLPLKVIAYRATAKDYPNTKLNFLKGRAVYRMGSDFPLLLIRSLFRMRQKPYIVAGLSYFWGYMYSFLLSDEKYVDNDLQKFINKFHYKRILRVFKILA